MNAANEMQIRATATLGDAGPTMAAFLPHLLSSVLVVGVVLSALRIAVRRQLQRQTKATERRVHAADDALERRLESERCQRREYQELDRLKATRIALEQGRSREVPRAQTFTAALHAVAASCRECGALVSQGLRRFGGTA